MSLHEYMCSISFFITFSVHHGVGHGVHHGVGHGVHHGVDNGPHTHTNTHTSPHRRLLPAKTRPRNSDKRVIWTFLISISLCLLSYVSLPTTDTSGEERGCVCVCVCMYVGLLGRSLAAANIQLSVCWLSSVRHFVGLIILDTGWGQLLTIDNLEI